MRAFVGLYFGIALQYLDVGHGCSIEITLKLTQRAVVFFYSQVKRYAILPYFIHAPSSVLFAPLRFPD